MIEITMIPLILIFLTILTISFFNCFLFTNLTLNIFTVTPYEDIIISNMLNMQKEAKDE